MNEWLTKVGAGVLISALSSFLGSTNMFKFLLLLMLLDFITGIIASGIQGELMSKVGYKGILRKLLIIGVVAACAMVDVLLNTQPVELLNLQIDNPVFTLASFFYVGNELLSILENAERSGVPVPTFVKNAFQSMKDKGDGKNE